MGNKIFQDGKIYHETFTGSYTPETTVFGNPKMNLDFWGNPIIKTDMFGNQIVDLDMFGNPKIPVEYPTKSDIGSRTGTVSNSGDGFGVFFTLLPFLLLAGGLYSVFATMAGSLIFVIAAVGILGMLIITLISDYAHFIHISNGIQQPFYIFSTGWVFGIVPFWINFFFSMNFDVSNTNYLTWDSMMSIVFPQMGVCACIGIAFGTLLSFLFRSDMHTIRKLSTYRFNKQCVVDMLIASFALPVMAVPISLIWCLIIAPIVSLFTKQTWSNIGDKQATVMAIAFVITGVIIVVKRFSTMVTSDFNKKKLIFIILPLLLLISISIGIYFYNHPAKSSTTTVAAETTAKQLVSNSNKTNSPIVYLNEVSVLADKYDKIYSENDRAATDSKEAGDADGYTKYMNNIIINEKEYSNQLGRLNVPTELQDLHRINLERLQIFIEYLPYQINCYFDDSTKDIRDSKYETYIQKKIELYNEYVRIKNKLGIETDFETVFSMKIPQ
jgi:hypothetical protein